MQITTSIEPRHIITVRMSGRGNVRIDAAPVSDPEATVSMPLGRTSLRSHMSVNSLGTVYGLSVRAIKGKVLAKTLSERHVDLTVSEKELLEDLVGELRGIQQVASRL